MLTREAANIAYCHYDVAPDGRFLMIKRNVLSDQKPAAMVVVVNWFEELKRLLPAN